MALTLRPTGLSSPAYADRLDCTVFDDGKPTGHMYEDNTRQSFHGFGRLPFTSILGTGYRRTVAALAWGNDDLQTRQLQTDLGKFGTWTVREQSPTPLTGDS